MAKTIKIEHANHSFEVRVSIDNHFGGVAKYYVYLVTHPERKFFRTTYLNTVMYWIDTLDSIRQGVEIAVEQVWEKELRRQALEKKIADFENNA